MFKIPHNASSGEKEILTNLFSQIRKHKIKNIYNEKSFKFTRSNIPDEAYDIIISFTEKYGGIVTGSFVLKGYGLISRDIGDLDLLITQSQYDNISKDMSILKHRYGGLDIDSDGYIQYYNHPIDLFIISDDDYLKRGKYIQNDLYFDDPFKIVESKISFAEKSYGSDRDKDWRDFVAMSKYLETGNYYIYQTPVIKKKWYQKMIFWKQ
jgi:hypothetical protein